MASWYCCRYVGDSPKGARRFALVEIIIDGQINPRANPRYDVHVWVLGPECTPAERVAFLAMGKTQKKTHMLKPSVFSQSEIDGRIIPGQQSDKKFIIQVDQPRAAP